MQRRAAAIYAAIFIVIAAGSYAVIGVAQEPAVTVDDPDHTVGSGDTLTLDGRTYTVGEIQGGTNEGDDLRSVDLTWVNESARHTESLGNNTTVGADLLDGDDAYRVLILNGEDPSSFTFVQERNVSAVLEADPAVENQTVTRADGRQYVVYRDNGSTRPLSEYLPESDRQEFAEGDQFRYNGTDTTVVDVSNESVTIEWTAPQNNTISLDEGTVTTLQGTDYIAHFPDNSTLELTTDVEEYERKTAAVDRFSERISGLWGISIISGLAAIILLGTAYLPSRY